MIGKRAEDRVRVSLRVHCVGKVMVEASDGFPDSIDGAVGVVCGAVAMLILKLGNFFQVAEDLRFDGLGSVLVFQDASSFFSSRNSANTKIVGPAYREIAAKYKADPDAAAKAEQQIHNGGSSKWGAIIMPPFPQVTTAETKILSEWILGLK